MRSTTASLALLATLAVAPIALAQTPRPSDQGTTANPSGGTTATSPGTVARPGTPNTAVPGMANPGIEVPASGVAPGGGARPGAGTGATAPGTNNPPTTASPVAGSNSFTEGQARSRIEAAGYSDVGPLTQDGAGVWRGRAMRNGAAAEVGLDFQGNVVTGAAR